MRSLIVLFMVVWGHFVQAQAISDIRISPDGVAVLYLKDSDSLFLQDLSKDSSSRQFLASGLKQNFNQRFLKWSPNARHFMWEYNQQLFLYDVLAEQASSIDLRALRLGMYFRIDQVALSNDGKVFFSGASEEEAYFGLYKGNFRTGTYELLSAPEGHVANISLSPDQNLLGYSVYRYLNDQYHASMHLMNPESKMPLGESTWYPNCFFQGLSFSDAGALMARNVLGRAYVFELPELEDFLEEVAAPEPEGVYFLQFKGDDILSLEQTDGLWSYSLRKASGELIKSLGRRESNEKWYWQAYPQQWMSYEDGVHPKTLFEFQGGKKVEIYSFAQNNPLEETPFSIVEYTNGAEKKSEAFVYGEGSKGLIILPYGGYSNRYPKLDYFLNQLAFPLLDQGFVLAFLNTRGYANQKLGKNYGVVQLEDTELFLDFWQAQPGQAGKPVFLLGHSHGATMVYYYLTHSQRFAGGIAINGASDWIGQARLQRMTGLPGEMGGTPEQDAALYQEASPLEQIAKNMPPVLIVSGALDTQIPAGINALAFYKKARKKRVKARQLHFADQGHLILGKAAMAELQEEVKKFLKKYSR